MKSVVAAAFTDYQKAFEGSVPHFYLDVKGLVTCAIGLLCEPIAIALAMPWTVGGYAATQQEISDDWHTVKSHQELAEDGGARFAPLTRVRLTDAGIASVTLQKAQEMEPILRHYFPNYDSAPADAQLGLWSLAWACGPAFAPQWPKFTAAFLSEDWETCAQECDLSTIGNPGVVPRNAACRKLFMSAASSPDAEALTGWP